MKRLTLFTSTFLSHTVCFYCIVSSHSSPLHRSCIPRPLSSGQLNYGDSEGEMNPKLWVALSGGKVVVFDAASWSMLQGSIQVGSSQLVSADMLYYTTNHHAGTTIANRNHFDFT